MFTLLQLRNLEFYGAIRYLSDTPQINSKSAQGSRSEGLDASDINFDESDLAFEQEPSLWNRENAT